MNTATHSNVYDGTLLNEIVSEQKLSRELVKKAAHEMLVIIKEGLLRDGVVRVNHFGSFKLKRVAARKGRNPQTGEVITIPERNRIIFTPCKALRELISPVKGVSPSVAKPAIKKAVKTNEPETVSFASRAVSESTQARVVSRSNLEVKPFDDNKVAIDKLASQLLENNKNNKIGKRTYFGIAASIVAMVAVIAVLQLLEKPEQSVAVPQPVKKAMPEFVASIESKSVEEVSMPVSVVASAKGGIVEREVELQKLKPEITQSLTPQKEMPQIKQQASVIKEDDNLSSKANIVALPLSTAEALAMQSVDTVVAADTSVQRPLPKTTEHYFTGQVYGVIAGNSLWRLSQRFYNQPLYWPHIFYANSDKILNPDKLSQGVTVFIPNLEGEPGHLTVHDRTNIAEGYFLAYTFYKKAGDADAIFALLEAKRYSAEVVERNMDALVLSRVELFLLEQQKQASDI